MKAYTDLEQSRKLAKILPLESSDMWYQYIGTTIEDGSKKPVYYPMFIRDHQSDEDVPCWSLVALLGVLPKIGSEEPMIQKLYYTNNPMERYICQYSLTNMTSEYDNPVDACYELVLQLHERKML